MLLAAAAALSLVMAGCTVKAERRFGESLEAFETRYAADADSDLYRQALLQVADSGEATAPWAKARFSAALADAPSPLVREAAAYGIMQQQQGGVPTLVSTMSQDSSPLVRQSAARMLLLLARQSPSRVSAEDQPLLAQAARKLAAEDPDRDVRIAALDVLSFDRTRETLDAVIAVLPDSDFAVSYAARRTLMLLTGQSLGYRPAEWTDWLAGVSDPFAGAGEVPPQLRKQELNLLERAFLQYRWRSEFE